MAVMPMKVPPPQLTRKTDVFQSAKKTMTVMLMKVPPHNSRATSVFKIAHPTALAHPY